MHKTIKNSDIIISNMHPGIEFSYKISKSDFAKNPISKVIPFEKYINIIDRVVVGEHLSVYSNIGGEEIVLEFPIGSSFQDGYIYHFSSENLIAAGATYEFKRSVTTMTQCRECKFVKMHIVAPENFKLNAIFPNTCSGKTRRDSIFFEITMGGASEYLFPLIENSIYVTMPYDENITIRTVGISGYNNFECNIEFIITHFKY